MASGAKLSQRGRNTGGLHTGTEDELGSPRKKPVGPERRESEKPVGFYLLL